MPKFQLPEYPRSGSKAMSVERKRKREKERKKERKSVLTNLFLIKSISLIKFCLVNWIDQLIFLVYKIVLSLVQLSPSLFLHFKKNT